VDGFDTYGWLEVTCSPDDCGGVQGDRTKLTRVPLAVFADNCEQAKSVTSGAVGNVEIAGGTQFVSVQAGAQDFSITDDARDLVFAATGSASVTVTPSTHTVTVGCTNTNSGGTVTSMAAGTGLTTNLNTSLAGAAITSTGTISIKDKGVGTTQLADDAVTGSKIANGTIEFSDVGQNTCKDGEAPAWNDLANTWACQKVYTQTEVDDKLAALKVEILAACGKGCPPDMVPVGDVCVDVVEASVWSRVDGQAVVCDDLQKAVAAQSAWNDADWKAWYRSNGDGTSTHTSCSITPAPAICQFRQYGNTIDASGTICPGSTCDDYPAEWPDSGNWTKKLYACAVKGVYPSRSLTWFQAQQACAASGRHLITNGEWQAAVAGTPDPGASNAGDDGPCNTSGSLGARRTGRTAGPLACVSKSGVEDLIGNLWEWVDLWGQAGYPWMSASGKTIDESKMPWPKGYGDTCGAAPNETSCDKTWNVNGESVGPVDWTSGLPFAALRGGYWSNGTEAGAFAFAASHGPSTWFWAIGFRCSRGM
jgi:formylglycine-generating enzyme required for sulfatase activity